MSNATAPRPLVLSDATVITPDESVYGPYPYSDLQAFGFALVAFFAGLSLTACGLRVYSCRLSKGFLIDDWMVFLAMAMALVHAVFTAFVLKAAYWGFHEWEIPRNLPTNIGEVWLFVNSALYNPIFALVKLSVLVFLLRIGGTKRRVRIACWIMIIFNCLQVMVFLTLTIIQCLPVGAVWMMTPKERRTSPQCIRREVYAISQAVANMTTDALTILIPFWVFFDLKVNKRIRNALLGIFLLGSVVTIVSAVRLYYVIRLYYLKPTDGKYSLGYVADTVEIHLAIVTASVPALWPLARRWFPSLFVSLGISRPYLHPDIEVGYATTQGSTQNGGSNSKTLRGKVVWRDLRHVLGGAVSADADGNGSQVSLTDMRGKKGGGGPGIAGGNKDSWEDYGDDVFVTRPARPD